MLNKSAPKIILTLIISMLLTVHANALQTLAVQDGSEVSASISKTQLTRIKIIEDKISSLRMTQGVLEIIEDVEKGEVYIRPNLIGDKSIGIFISSEKGHTYKLSLHPKEMGADQIFLNSKSRPVVEKKANSKVSIRQLINSLTKEFNKIDKTDLESAQIISIEEREYSLMQEITENNLRAKLLVTANTNEFFADYGLSEEFIEKNNKWFAIKYINQLPSIGELSALLIVEGVK